MKDFSEDLLAGVRQLTGFDGDKLKCVTGAICTTVFLGKMPIKEDLADYLGVSKRVVMDLLRDVSIYPFATMMSLRGLYFGPMEEPLERMVARAYLGAMFDSRSVETAKVYAGYDITLEYLWRVAEGDNESIDDYIEGRFESGLKIPKKLQSFALLIYQQNRHLDLLSSNYSYVCEYLADGTRRARNQTLSSSAKNAKTRLERMLLIEL
ncbi:hypothetical protein IKG24_00450 [Candidatus Saccharibacteria bacterium]|nr:hypothetical protein [Candidatus Saccharibacteria bacterium]